MKITNFTMLFVALFAVFVFNLASAYCDSYSPALFAPGDAQEVQYSKSRGQDELSYKVKTTYPADSLIAAISNHLKDWKPQEFQFLNPKIPTAHRKGWGSYTDATTTPVSFLFQWWGEWKDNSDNVVLYVLQYRDFITKKSDESAWFAKPATSVVEVSAAYIPAKKAQQLAKEGADQVKEFANKYPEPSLPREDQSCAQGTIDYLNGKWYQSEVYQKDLSASPTWDPVKQLQPPLATGKAIELATTKIGELFPPVSDWQVVYVMLNRSFKQNYWYYQVFFVTNLFPEKGELKDYKNQTKSTFSILVLMNGKVIDPSIREESSASKQPCQ